MECVACQQQQSNYKCPTCRQPYCSVACYKRHREAPCAAPPPPAVPEEPRPPPIHEYNFPTTDTVPADTLQLLEHSSELRHCLENPHLRAILETLDRCEHPDSTIKHYMQEPIFTEFVDACLKVVTNVRDADD